MRHPPGWRPLGAGVRATSTVQAAAEGPEQRGGRGTKNIVTPVGFDKLIAQPRITLTHRLGLKCDGHGALFLQGDSRFSIDGHGDLSIDGSLGSCGVPAAKYS